MRHEGATPAVSTNRQVAVYMGDDARGEYLYRFVSEERFDADKPEANRDLLDRGVLSVARFETDGTLRWIPLIHGQGKLTADEFPSPADVLIETRRAAKLSGATPMDRPEDIEVHHRTGKVYVMLTNNTDRKEGDTNAANPRPKNKHGHILELVPPADGSGFDHTATTYKWDLLLLAGIPGQDGARYPGGVSENGWLSCPDNCAIDPQGRLWIATDGANSAAKVADGLYACELQGPARALTRHFFRVPRGAEMCGPCFTPDGTTLFLSVQHPGEGSIFAKPSTRWPDFDGKLPPRPSIVAITRQGGGPIGS